MTDPRKLRLDAATTELAIVDIDVWKLATAARILLAASGDSQARAVAAEIQSLEDRRVLAKTDIHDLYAEMGLDAAHTPARPRPPEG
jgi:hypothetical protein